MNKISIIVGGIILIIVGVVLAKDMAIKKELSMVEQAQEVKSDDNEQKEIDSSISLKRVNGVWTSTSTGDYSIDTNSLKFEFTGYKPGGEHVGTFNTATVNIGLDTEGNPVQAEMSFEVSSVKTDTSALDTHLQTADFFNATEHPNITVKLKNVKGISETSAQAIVDITMKGVTKTISVPVSFVKTEGQTKFMIDTRVNIADFAIAYGPVLNEVRITTEGVILKK